jgi:hypothetical protein
MGILISLLDRKKRQEIDQAIARGSVPLITTHTKGEGSNPCPPDPTLNERILRIKETLGRIDTLMKGLKDGQTVSTEEIKD